MSDEGSSLCYAQKGMTSSQTVPAIASAPRNKPESPDLGSRWPANFGRIELMAWPSGRFGSADKRALGQPLDKGQLLLDNRNAKQRASV